MTWAAVSERTAIRISAPISAEPPNIRAGLGRSVSHLVFLRHETIDGIMAWVAIAAFAIEYQPDNTGEIVGTLSADGQAMTVAVVGDSLRRLALRAP